MYQKTVPSMRRTIGLAALVRADPKTKIFRASYNLSLAASPKRINCHSLRLYALGSRPGFSVEYDRFSRRSCHDLADMVHPTGSYQDMLDSITTLYFDGIESPEDHQVMERFILPSWNRSGFFCWSMMMQGFRQEERRFILTSITGPNGAMMANISAQGENPSDLSEQLRSYCKGNGIRFTSQAAGYDF